MSRYSRHEAVTEIQFQISLNPPIQVSCHCLTTAEAVLAEMAISAVYYHIRTRWSYWRVPTDSQDDQGAHDMRVELGLFSLQKRRLKEIP